MSKLPLKPKAAPAPVVADEPVVKAPKVRAAKKEVVEQALPELPAGIEAVDEIPEGAVIEDGAGFYVDPYDFVYEVKTVGKPIVGLNAEEVLAFMFAVMGKVKEIKVSRKTKLTD